MGITFPEPKLPVAGFSSFYPVLSFLSSFIGFTNSIKRGQKGEKSAIIDLGLGVKKGVRIDFGSKWVKMGHGLMGLQVAADFGGHSLILAILVNL